MARSLEAGLLDAVGVELVPVVLGGDAAVRRARRHPVQFEGRRGGRGRRRHAPALPGTEIGLDRKGRAAGHPWP